LLAREFIIFELRPHPSITELLRERSAAPIATGWTKVKLSIPSPTQRHEPKNKYKRRDRHQADPFLLPHRLFNQWGERVRFFGIEREASSFGEVPSLAKRCIVSSSAPTNA
jgi:hypothetical protein